MSDLVTQARRDALLSDALAALDLAETVYRSLDRMRSGADHGLTDDQWQHAHADAFIAYQKLAHVRQVIEGAA